MKRMIESNIWIISVITSEEGGTIMAVYDNLNFALEHRRNHRYQLMEGEKVIIEGLVLNESDYDPEEITDPLYV